MLKLETTSLSRAAVRTRAACAMAVLAASLAACGGSNSRPADPSPPPAPPSAMDTFFAYVEAKIATLLDTDEPAAIEGVSATAPENTEPEPLK